MCLLLGFFFCLAFLCDIGLVLLSLQVLFDEGQIFLVHIFQEARHILIRHLDNPLPSEKGSVSIARLQVIDVVAFRKQVFAEHVSPNFREISAEFMGKTFRTTCMAKVHKLGQEVLMFTIGGDAS